MYFYKAGTVIVLWSGANLTLQLIILVSKSCIFRFLYDLIRSLNMTTALSSPKDYEELLNKYDTWMFDCDGVLWSGDELIDGAIEVLDILRSHSTSPVLTQS